MFTVQISFQLRCEHQNNACKERFKRRRESLGLLCTLSDSLENAIEKRTRKLKLTKHTLWHTLSCFEKLEMIIKIEQARSSRVWIVAVPSVRVKVS